MSRGTHASGSALGDLAGLEFDSCAEPAVDLDFLGYRGFDFRVFRGSMTVFNRALEIAKTRQARVVFPEMAEPRIAEAAAWMAERGVVTPMPLAEISEAQMAALVDRWGVKERVALG